jgi:high affinity Mn2+ porin
MTSFARTSPGLAIATLVAAMQPVLPAAAQPDDSRRSGGSFYAGAHVGFMFGNASATLSNPVGIGSQGATAPYSALFGGVQSGWECCASPKAFSSPPTTSTLATLPTMRCAGPRTSSAAG